MVNAGALQCVLPISVLTLFLCIGVAVSAPLTSTQAPSGGTAVETNDTTSGVDSMESTSSAEITTSPDLLTATPDDLLIATDDSTGESTSINTGDMVTRMVQVPTQTLSNTTTRDQFTKLTTTVKTTTTTSATTITLPFNIGTVTRQQTIMPNNPSDPPVSTQRETDSQTTTTTYITSAALGDDSDDDKVSMSDSQKTGLIVGIILLAVVIVMVTAIAMYWRHRRYRQWEPATGDDTDKKQYKMMCYARRKDGPVFCEIDTGDIEEEVVATEGTVEKTTDDQGMKVEQNKNRLLATGNGGGDEARVFIAENRLKAESEHDKDNGDMSDDKELDSNENKMAAIVKRSTSSGSSSSASGCDKHSSGTELNRVDVIEESPVIHDNDAQSNSTDSSHTAEEETHDTDEDRMDDTHDDTHEVRSDDTREVRSDDTHEVRSDDTREVRSDDTHDVRSDDTRDVRSDDTRDVRSDDTHDAQPNDGVYHVERDSHDIEASQSVESQTDTSSNTSVDQGHDGDDPDPTESGSVELLQNVEEGNVTSDLSDLEPDDPVRTRKDPDTGSEDEIPDVSRDKDPAETKIPVANRDADIVVHTEQSDDSPVHNEDFTGRGEVLGERGEVVGERGEVLVGQGSTDNGVNYSKQDDYQPREGEPE